MFLTFCIKTIGMPDLKVPLDITSFMWVSEIKIIINAWQLPLIQLSKYHSDISHCDVNWEGIHLKVGCLCFWYEGGCTYDNVVGTENVVCCRFLCLVDAAVTHGTMICTALTWTGCCGVASKSVHHIHKSLIHVVCVMQKLMCCCGCEVSGLLWCRTVIACVVLDI
jgi:hypothetical protein